MLQEFPFSLGWDLAKDLAGTIRAGLGTEVAYRKHSFNLARNKSTKAEIPLFEESLLEAIANLERR
jgi:hypothetical protein